MSLRIAKIISLSTVDIPNYPCSVVFLAGCNLNCKFCHNFPLISSKEGESMDIENIAKELNNYILADAVSFTGGEPLMQVGNLSKLITFLPDKLVSIDHNGTMPGKLEELVKLKNVERIAIDLKCNFNRYSELCGISLDPNQIKQNIADCIKIVLDAEKKLEIRTTYSKDLLNFMDLNYLVQFLEDCNYNGTYLLQPYRNMGVRSEYNFIEPNQVEMDEIVEKLRNQSLSFKIKSR